MTFDENISRSTNNNPFYILTLAKTQLQSFFLRYAPDVYIVNFDNLYLFDALWTSGQLVVNIENITAVIIDTSPLVRTVSISECQLTPNSFYYNSGQKNLYIHIAFPWWCFSRIKIGLATYFGKNFAGYRNGVQVKDNLLSIPNITKKKTTVMTDNPNFLYSGDFTIANREGEFDRFTIDNPEYIGNDYILETGFIDRYKVNSEWQWLPNWDTITEVARGSLDSVSLRYDQMILKCKSQLASMTMPLPARKISSVTWPNISDDDNNSPIPLLYGSVRKIPLICLNKEENPAPTNYRFLICDITYHQMLSTAVIPIVDNDENTAITAKTIQYDNTNKIAYIDIPRASFPGSAYQDISIIPSGETYINGYKNSDDELIEYALDIIKDLFLNYYGYPFTSTFFDLSRWSTSYDLRGGIYLSDTVEFETLIGKIAYSSYINFNITPTGKLYGKIFNINETPVIRIDSNKIPDEKNISFEQGKNDYYSSVTVEYAKDYKDDKYLTKSDSSLENTILDMNAFKKEFIRRDTLLVYDADVATWAEKFLQEYSTLPPTKLTFPVTLYGIKWEPGDRIIVEHTNPQFGVWDEEISTVNLNLNNNAISIETRLIQEITGYRYLRGNYWGGFYWGEKMYTDKIYYPVS